MKWNALKPIEVKAEVQDGLVAITIEDSGCGMSAETQRDALTLFATSKPNGTGFGLPLAVKIVESEHRGRLEVDSLKGRGTIVRITIPTHHQRRSPCEEPSHRADRRGRQGDGGGPRRDAAFNRM